MAIYAKRPKIQNEESFSSYLMRLAVVNGTTLKNEIEHHTFSIIKDKFLEPDDMTLLQFLGELIQNKYRKYCSMCLNHLIAYKLIWQVKDIYICDIHQIHLQNSCQKCLKKLPYAHESLGSGMCPYCFNKLSGQIYKRELLKSDYDKEYLFPKGKELAKLLLYVAQDQYQTRLWIAVRL